MKLNFYFTPVEIEILNDQPTLKSSRSPPYAATRNFCTLKIFCRPACSIFGAPKFSTCDMKILRLDPSNFSDICDALKLCRDPTSPVEIKHSAFYPFLKSAPPLLNDQPTDKRSFLGGNQKRLRFFTPQRGRIGSFGSNIFSKLGQPARPQPAPRPLRPQNRPFSNKEPHISLDANLKNRFQFLSSSTISNDFPDFASEMSRGIAIDFAIHFAIDFAIDFAAHLPPILPHKLTKAPTPAKPSQK